MRVAVALVVVKLSKLVMMEAGGLQLAQAPG